MRVLLDINILLDVILEREPWHHAAARLLSWIDEGRLHGFVASHTLPTIHYVVTRARDRGIATTAVSDLLRVVDVVPVEKDDLHHALVLPVEDFEDAIQLASGLRIGADYIVTRNEKDFRAGSIPPIEADRLMAVLRAER
ncbi:MAG: PIN domain-containing protein [Longimicrobiales bacterium]|nr:PIN domain-containing protein [Longimicrobiales bacterium]